VVADRDPFATSFLPSMDTTTNQDLAPRPLECEEAVATALEPMALVPVGEAPESSEAPAPPAEEPPAGAAYESRRSKRKDRRGRKGGPTASTPTPPPVIPQPADAPAAPPMLAAASEPSLRVPETAEPSAADADSFEQPGLEEESGRPWWLSVAVALVLIGVAGALIFLFLGQ
jgi:hypothetical protein